MNYTTLLDVYCKDIRSILEHAVPAWHSGLTRKQAAQIERVQKTAFKIILENDYIDYETACTLLCVEPLEFRRIQLCLNFAKRDFKKDETIFTRTCFQPNTRAKPKQVKEFRCRTSRYQKNSVPYLSRLLNTHLWTNKCHSVTCYLMDYGCKAQLIVLCHCLTHKFAVPCILPLVFCLT